MGTSEKQTLLFWRHSIIVKEFPKPDESIGLRLLYPTMLTSDILKWTTQYHACIHTQDLPRKHAGSLPVQFPWKHILVSSPDRINPTLQVYVATVPFDLVPVPFNRFSLYFRKAPLLSGRSRQNATKNESAIYSGIVNILLL